MIPPTAFRWLVLSIISQYILTASIQAKECASWRGSFFFEHMGRSSILETPDNIAIRITRIDEAWCATKHEQEQSVVRQGVDSNPTSAFAELSFYDPFVEKMQEKTFDELAGPYPLKFRVQPVYYSTSCKFAAREYEQCLDSDIKNTNPPGSSESPLQQKFAMTPNWIWNNILSPVDGPKCPHYPTCSEYCRKAINRFGIVQGTIMTASRLISESKQLESRRYFPYIKIHNRWRFYDPVPQP